MMNRSLMQRQMFRNGGKLEPIPAGNKVFQNFLNKFVIAWVTWKQAERSASSYGTYAARPSISPTAHDARRGNGRHPAGRSNATRARFRKPCNA